MEPLKEPLIFKIKEIFSDFIENNLAKENIDNKLHDKIENSSILGWRSLALKVKIIIKYNHKHLGWLVVWGSIWIYFRLNHFSNRNIKLKTPFLDFPNTYVNLPDHFFKE